MGSQPWLLCAHFPLQCHLPSTAPKGHFRWRQPVFHPLPHPAVVQSSHPTSSTGSCRTRGRQCPRAAVPISSSCFQDDHPAVPVGPSNPTELSHRPPLLPIHMLPVLPDEEHIPCINWTMLSTHRPSTLPAGGSVCKVGVQQHSKRSTV